MIWSGCLKERKKKGLWCHVTSSHLQQEPMTSQHLWRLHHSAPQMACHIFHLVCECVRTEYGKCNVSDTPAVCRSVAWDFPSQSSTAERMQSSALGLSHLCITHRVACMCCWRCHSPLRRGSPVCCVMRKAWGPVCISDPASCLWGDLPAHPKNSAWDRGQQLQSQDKNNREVDF